MNPHIATVVYLAGIIGLFFLDREPKERVSKALWIPVLWLLIIGSRAVSAWLNAGPTIPNAAQYAEGSPIDATVFGLLIGASGLVLIARRRQVVKVLRLNLPILLFFLYCALSIAWSDHSLIASKRWVKAVGDFAMVLVVLTDRKPVFAMRQLFSRVAFLLIPLSILFIKYYPAIGRTYNQWTWTPMYCGVTTYKNLLGMTCLVCGLGSLWSLVGAYAKKKDARRMPHLAAHGAIFIATVWLLKTADSMTSLSCFLMAGMIMVASTQRWVIRRRMAVHALVCSVVAFSLCALFVDPRTLLTFVGRDPSLTGRTEIWSSVLSLHSNPLVGRGFESFWLGNRLNEIVELTGQHLQEAHDGYLEVYLNLGWIGLAFLSGIAVSGYRNILATLRKDRGVGNVRLAFFTAGLIYSMTEAGFRMMSPVWFAFLLVVTVIPPTSLRAGHPSVRVLRTEEPSSQINPADIFGETVEAL